MLSRAMQQWRVKGFRAWTCYSRPQLPKEHKHVACCCLSSSAPRHFLTGRGAGGVHFRFGFRGITPHDSTTGKKQMMMMKQQHTRRISLSRTRDYSYSDVNRTRSMSTENHRAIAAVPKGNEKERHDSSEASSREKDDASESEESPPIPPLPPPFPLGATSFMILSVMASNYLVQFPVSDWFTIGSLTYPVSFLVCDVTNRLYGAKRARLVVYTGFAAGLPMSLIVSPFRIALASGLSFLTSQLVDVMIFDKLRHKAWWKAPLISTCISSCLDSYLFTFLAFYGDQTMPSWVSLATGDAAIKLLVALVSLGPFRLFIQNKLKSGGKG